MTAQKGDRVLTRLQRFARTVSGKLLLLGGLALAGLATVGLLGALTLRGSLMDGRTEAVRLQVETAVSLLEHFHALEVDGTLTREQAQQQARDVLRDLRYEDTEYFFVSDLDLRLVAHPLRIEQEGEDISDLTDADGLALYPAFRDAVVEGDGGGFVAYQAAARMGSDDLTPKVSWVQLFEPWEWIVGSGVYVDAVAAAMAGHLLALVLQLGVVMAVLGIVLALIGRGLTRTLRGADHRLDATAASLHDSADELAAVAEEGAGHAAEVSDGGQDVSQGIQSVATAVEEMTATIDDIARSAEQARATAAEAVELADGTDTTIREVGDTSQELEQVVDLIVSVAEQTNLLALNATIEAARAGEAGKGFAVVAGEVKSLATETEQATTRIRDIVGENRDRASDAASSIERLTAVLGRIDHLQDTVAAAVQEQSSAAGEISRSVQQAAQGAQGIAEGVERVAEATDRTSEGARSTASEVVQLREVAQDLRSVVSFGRRSRRRSGAGAPGSATGDDPERSGRGMDFRPQQPDRDRTNGAAAPAAGALAGAAPPREY